MPLPVARLLGPFDRWLRADGDGTLALVRRLLVEDGLPRWRRYALTLMLMTVSGGCTALFAFFVGHMVNQAYVYRSLAGILGLSLAIVAIFTLRGLATYGQ